jgi:hypothetical protein
LEIGYWVLAISYVYDWEGSLASMVC